MDDRLLVVFPLSLSDKMASVRSEKRTENLRDVEDLYPGKHEDVYSFSPHFASLADKTASAASNTLCRLVMRILFLT